jgi:threonine dehydrogenase-like Zn-dependent dehydrogenase
MDYVGANFPYFPAFLIRLISSRAENDESRREVQPGLWLEEVPVLIRVLKTSICGTDVTA